MSSSELKRSIARATKWASITEIVAKLITPITTMILARILAPDAFGVISTVTMIISFVDMLTDAGFQKYLIQREFRDDEEKSKNASVAFWTNLGLSIFLWVVIALFSEQIASLVGNPGLGIVIAVACIQLPISSFSSIQMALYRRSFDFRTLFWARLASICTPFIITIPLAKFGADYWSLIIGTIIGGVANAIILTVKSEWKPKMYYSVKTLKRMLSFSIWSLIEAMTIWLTTWVDIFIIGNHFTDHLLGLYKTSTTMVSSLLALVTAATTPILFSALSRLQNDTEEFYRMFLKMQRLVAILILPLGVGIYLFSDLAVLLFLGDKWGESSLIIGMWGLTSSIMIIFNHYSSELYRAKGRPKLSSLAQLLHLVVLIPACIVASKSGFWIFVTVRCWIRIQGIIVQMLIMKYVIRFPLAKMMRNVLPVIIATLIMGVVGYLLKQVYVSTIWDVLCIVICVVSYMSLLCFFPDIRKELMMVVKNGRGNKKIM